MKGEYERMWSQVQGSFVGTIPAFTWRVRGKLGTLSVEHSW